MKLGKLAVSLTAAAVMGAFAPAFAQTSSTYGTSPDASTTPSMKNTDDTAPPVVKEQQDESSSPGDSASPKVDRAPSAPSAPVSGTYRTNSSDQRQPAPY